MEHANLYLVLLFGLGCSGRMCAQEIAGRVLDETKQPLINATVEVFRGDTLKGGNVADYDGNYRIKPLDSGYYDVLFIYAGYDSVTKTDVLVTPGQRTTVNVSMKKRLRKLRMIHNYGYPGFR